jgi:hypothetical protein
MASTSTDQIRGARSSLGFKAPCATAASSNITLSGEQTIAGVTTDESRVLVYGQSTGADNGIYVSGAGDWVRAPDFDGNSDVVTGTIVRVHSGTNKGYYEVTTSGTITIGTTGIAFAQVTASATGNPSSDDGEALGVAGASKARWSDLYLADSGVIYMGDSGAIMLTQTKDTGGTRLNIDGDDANADLRLTSKRILDTGRIGDSGFVAKHHDDVLRADTGRALFRGYIMNDSGFDHGTDDSGTLVFNPLKGQLQRAILGGATHVGPDTGTTYALVAWVKNNAAASNTLDTAKFTVVTGDTYDNDTGDNYLFDIRKIGAFSHLHITALQ